jgi:pyrimidine operon attenuation protein/uracil phosphoribosyltransferase
LAEYLAHHGRRRESARWRIAHEIVEHTAADSLAIIGIQRRGVQLAERVATCING